LLGTQNKKKKNVAKNKESAFFFTPLPLYLIVLSFCL
jgi:hypothetical protein